MKKDSERKFRKKKNHNPQNNKQKATMLSTMSFMIGKIGKTGGRNGWTDNASEKDRECQVDIVDGDNARAEIAESRVSEIVMVNKEVL